MKYCDHIVFNGRVGVHACHKVCLCVSVWTLYFALAWHNRLWRPEGGKEQSKEMMEDAHNYVDGVLSRGEEEEGIY